LVFAIKIVNRVGWIKSFPILLSLLFANFFVTQFSLQYFPVMAISLIGGIWMCNNEQTSQKKCLLFLFIIGMVTAFFDLLTNPLLTIGVPLIVYLLLLGNEERTFWELFKSIFVLSMFWFIGFSGAWLMKWILAALFAGPDTFGMAIKAVQWRTTTGDYTRWDAVVRNFNQIPIKWLCSILSCMLLLTLFCFNKKGVKFAILFLIIGLFPYVWYFILSSHTHPHFWFTYRAQIISMSCAMLFFVFLIDWEKLFKKFRREKTSC
jgi:hypothetical protein